MLAEPALHYDQPLYRPPSEGRNLIIQATIGCSFNHCTFCSMYKAKMFRPRPLDEVCADIDAAARHWPEASRVFLADGDALVLPTDDLPLSSIASPPRCLASNAFRCTPHRSTSRASRSRSCGAFASVA
jgi:radical SAM superfamily enzyme YgiQ (UPF0313 family)